MKHQITVLKLIVANFASIDIVMPHEHPSHTDRSSHTGWILKLGESYFGSKSGKQKNNAWGDLHPQQT